MKLSIKIFILLLILISFSPASASPCGKDGMTALRANDGNGFLFYVFRNGPDIYFALTGKQISFPNGTDGPRRFLIDGIFYESLTVKPKEFMKSEKDVADLDILKRHQAYETEHIKTTASPLKEFEELGARTKPAGNGQPGFTFHLWVARAPGDTKGTRQFFLTTVSNGDVVVLTAIVRDLSAVDSAMESLQSYAASFQHVLKKEDCPPK